MGTDKDLQEILRAIAAVRQAAEDTEKRVAELVSGGRQHVVIAVENMEREVKESKGLLVWLKSWAQRLHK